MPESDTASKLDDETTAALTLFNNYVEADRERTLREKRVRKAERAKDEAAAAVKKLGDSGSAEDKAAAEQTYRDAADRWKKLRDGEEPDEAPAPKAEAAAEEPPIDEATAGAEEPAEESPAEETAAETAEEIVAEEPVAEEPAAVEEPAAEEPAGEEPPTADEEPAAAPADEEA